ncbi:putative sporulation protein YtxC [Ornithinibacillus gellani]|uniref:sporulation protein YtxC n=1 Tax=Ornithinibacillus gellani TaxID=2293253 RepID=UPI000F46ABB4|nr:sporulation protein YtxC [Ornithinibacillus gellani]TQS76231.1 putative sporulation protein YtxC [Ornithinibacillus gellani]
MLEVYFESDAEAIGFCEYLFSYSKRIELNWKTNEDWGNRIQITGEWSTGSKQDHAATAMADVFEVNRLTPMLEEIISNCYYYTNEDEMERILELTHWLLKNDAPTTMVPETEIKPLQQLFHIFLDHVKQMETIHFDSIVKFRLGVVKDQLIHYVGLAIDEFKREEDHQTFINMLREYIEKKKSGFPVIHILQGDPFAFFKSSGKRFSNMELRMLMQQEPLYMVGLDSSEMNLAPLVAMAPNQIKIYGDNPSEPKTLTIINIFQERVSFQSLNQFPFPNYRKV